MRKFEVLGPDAEALLQYCLTRDVRRLAVGQVVYTALCYEHGGMIDDGTLFRLGQDNFRWIGGDPFGGEWLRDKAKAKGLEGVGQILDRPAPQLRPSGTDEPRDPQVK